MKEKYKFYILYALIAATTLPFLFIVKPATWSTSTIGLKSIALFYSAFFSYVGVSLLLWMYILGTRSVTGLYFKDVPKTLWLHRLMGKYGVMLIFLHPILIAYNYGSNLLTYTFFPNISTEFEQHVTYGRMAFFALLVIWLSSFILRGKIAYRPWKYIHYISYVVLPLSFLHAPAVGSSFKATAIQVYWWSFIATFFVFTVLRLRHLFGYGKVRYEVTKHSQVNDDVFVLHLHYLDKKLDLNIGQYVYIQLGLLTEEHPFTVLDYDNESGDVTIAYKVYGSYTSRMSKLLAADYVYVDGPYGVFTSDIDTVESKPVFIAAGIGITPFVKHVMDSSAKSQWLFYANQTKQTAVFRDYLKNKLGLQYVDILSRDNTAESSNEERGYISEQVFKKYLVEPLAHTYYICGSAGFTEAAKNALYNLGISETAIYAEEFDF